MKAIAGIDVHGAYKPALQLLARFRFAKTETTLAHFMVPAPAYYPMDAVASAQLQCEYLNLADNIGRDVLDEAKDEACRRNLGPKCVLRFGSPADGLVTLAEQQHADLVVVRSQRGSMWATSFLGSISRSLMIGCRTSILVAKNSIKEGVPLKIVLATDHSEESKRWIEKFLGWHPQGVSEIHVVTAYLVDDHHERILHGSLPPDQANVANWVEDHLRMQNDELVAKLAAAGYFATSHVAAGHTNDVIRETMQDTQADVLVIGAQGHGFMDRLLIGSCSMHQVVAEPYPVLVVRS